MIMTLVGIVLLLPVGSAVLLGEHHEWNGDPRPIIAYAVLILAAVTLFIAAAQGVTL